MKYITFYTDSHENMVNEYFLPSFNKYKLEKDSIYVVKGDQYNSNGTYFDKELYKRMPDKIKAINKFMNEKISYGEVFCYLDCDIVFLNNPTKLLEDMPESVDLMAQNDTGSHDNTICGGFMFIRKTNDSVNFFKKIEKETYNFIHDQECINHYRSEIKYSFFDHSKVFNIVNLTGAKPYNNSMGNILNGIDKTNIYVFHANWIVGSKDKINFMNEMLKI